MYTTVASAAVDVAAVATAGVCIGGSGGGGGVVVDGDNNNTSSRSLEIILLRHERKKKLSYILYLCTHNVTAYFNLLL